MISRATGKHAVARVPLLPSTRLSVYLMLYLAGLLQYALRYCLNMSIVCMVVPLHQQQYLNNTEDLPVNQTTQPSNESNRCNQETAVKKDFGFEGEFYWSRSQVGLILAAYFYAYIPMQVLAGWMADKFGIRHVLGTGMLIGGVLSLLTPVAARTHYGLLIALRSAMGFCTGVMFPCLHSCIGKWVPIDERSTFVGCTYSGPSSGVIFSFVLSGYLCRYSWTVIFYLLGGLIVLWYAGFLYVVYNHPDDHPRISAEESCYIKKSNRMITHVSKRAAKIPWKDMLTSRSVIGMCINHFTAGWLVYTIHTAVPFYMQDVLHFDIKANGLLSSLPSVINLVVGSVTGILCDFVLRTFIKSRRAVRKISHSIFCIGSGICTVLVGYMDCEQRTQAVVMFCLVFFFFCFIRGSANCSPSDIAPRMAGTVYGYTNFVGNFAGIFVPIAIGNLTPNGTQKEWQSIFFLSAGLLAAGWLCFVVLVSSDEQSWAKGDTETTDTRSEGNEGEHLTQLMIEIKNIKGRAGLHQGET